MALGFSKFAWHKSLNMTAFDLATDEIWAYLTDLQNCNVKFNGTNVFTMGSAGEKLVSFGHSSTVDVEAVSGLFEFGALGMILGATPIVGSTTEIYNIEERTVTSDAATSTYTALGTAGSELKFAYIVNADGSQGTKLTQDSVASSGKFSYTPGTKTITLDTGEVADDGKILIYYRYTAGVSTVMLEKKSDVFSKAVKLILRGVVRDVCDEIDYLAQIIIYKAKLTNELNIATVGAGEPATMSVNCEGMKNCNTTDMAKIFILDEDESV